MKVLLMTVLTSIVALQIKIQDLIPMQAEELLPISARNEENEEFGNTTTSQIFLQQQHQHQQQEQEQLQGGCFDKVLYETGKAENRAGFNSCWKKGSVICRSCPSCVASHKTICYVRLTQPTGAATDGFELFVDDWFSSGNQLHKDFELYSSVADVCAEKNKWSSCNYNDKGIGFPRDCGPKGLVGGNWNSRNRGGKKVKYTAQTCATTEATTTEAATEAAGTRSALDINLDFSKLVHEKFSQEAAHGTWNLQLNLDTDPCSVLTCKASSQCHAVGKCTKAGGGVCSDPFLAKGTPCDDKVGKTVNDVCDGKGLCAGVNIDLGCLEMHYDASKFAVGYQVQKWTDLAKKGHDATATGGVNTVRMDQTDKKRPYVPVIPNRYWNVAGSSFVKTIVSVFRRGDGGTTWNNYGATLARRSGRNSNWLFYSGRTDLLTNSGPDKVWKNGKELTKGSNFNMKPINKFMVLVVEVRSTAGNAPYYIGRSDHSVTRIDLQEILAYTRKLTDVERKQVETYLLKKWNVK